MLNVIGSIACNKFMGYEIPSVFDENWQQKAAKLYLDLRYFQRYQPDYIAKYAASEFFLKLIMEFDSKLQGKTFEKAKIYSAHDTSIMNIFATLGIYLEEQPPFGSVLLFEL